MELTLSNCVNEKFGKFENLRIELPLFNPSEKSKVPLLISDPALATSIISKHMNVGRQLWEEDDDDEISGKLRTGLVLLSFLDNVLPAGSPEHLFLFKMIIIGNAGAVTDEEMARVSEEYEIDIGYKHFVKRQSLLEKFLTQETTGEELENLQLLFPAAATPLTHLNNASRKAQQEIPDLWTKTSQGNEEFVKRISATVLAFEAEDWEEETLNEMQSYSTSLTPILEVIAGVRNVKIQRSIRDSYLFQRLINRFTILSRGLYNLTHLQEDLENGRMRENTLLRIAASSTTPLKDVIQTKVGEMKSIFKDIKVLGRKLEKTYPADENVFEFLEILQHAWDAQLLSLPHLPQFQHLNSRCMDS